MFYFILPICETYFTLSLLHLAVVAYPRIPSCDRHNRRLEVRIVVPYAHFGSFARQMFANARRTKNGRPLGADVRERKRGVRHCPAGYFTTTIS
jgi:hypothetical protein